MMGEMDLFILHLLLCSRSLAVRLSSSIVGSVKKLAIVD